jgi:hypothetical protein
MRWVALVALVSGSIGCRAIADSGATYRACDRGHYSENFAPGSTEKNLLERCWFFDNVEDPADLFVEDDDLVVRVGEGAIWGLDADGIEAQGPYAYRRLAKDFAVATRVEILNQTDSKHCLDPSDAAGIVMRKGGDWAALFVTLFTPDPPPPDLDCTSDVADKIPPEKGVVRSRFDVWGVPVESTGVEQAGIGADAEADIAMCRLNGMLTTYYRILDPSLEEPSWVAIGEGLVVGDGAVDIGLTATGPTAEAHFQWVEFADRIGSDGCTGTLERFQVPTFE